MGKKLIDYDEMHEEYLKNPEYVQALAACEPEYELADAMIKARIAAKKTQKEVAVTMETKQPVISRWESCNNKGISFENLVSYANAIGCEFVYRFVPKAEKTVR